MTHSGRPSTGPTGGRGYQEGHMNDGQLLPAGPRGQASNGAVQVYGTPFYEFMRVAWFVMGVAAIAWMYTLLMSYCSYSAYYRARAKGELLEFLISYHIRFLATVTCVTIYLAWPISNIIIEFALWIVFFIPWVIYRSLRKPNIGYLRPALPLDEMPGCIRLDMFFMDFTGMRRLGFSDPAWRLLTGTSQPLLPTCVDESTIDRDPMMPSLQQFGSTWSPNGTVMYPQMPMNQGQTQPHMMQQPQQQGPGNVVPGTEMSEGDNEEVQDRGRRHRRDRSRRRGERSAHRGTEEAGESVEPQGISPTRARSQTPGGGDEDAQGERHRRSRRSRSRRHSVRGGDWDNLDGTGGETRHRRHRRTGDAANSSRGNPTPQEIDRMLDEL
uniref:WGS project CAEQ00000000 data, annotated contig 2434 n=1 Tax=Trypanosoma congolense (strain IL3000) TaxID=1068625 RepID=F9WE40_TRYCI|nr:unnamed protein product [Trypanosoma congolense IL3000]